MNCLLCIIVHFSCDQTCFNNAQSTFTPTVCTYFNSSIIECQPLKQTNLLAVLLSKGCRTQRNQDRSHNKASA